MTRSLAAIVLAGGQSRRMGQDKALLPVEEGPLLYRTCMIALQCTPLVFVITPRPQLYQAVVPEQCQLIQETQAPNGQPQGPLVGFAQAMAQVEAEWVLLLACDLPWLQAVILQNWIGQLDDGTAAIALLPKSQKGWEPLCGFYHTACLPALTEFLQQGGRSFQGWLAKESVQAIAFSSIPSEYQQECRMLFNCNTPADWETVLHAAE